MGPEEMYDAVCADCGGPARVPLFQEMTDQSIAVIVTKSTEFSKL